MDKEESQKILIFSEREQKDIEIDLVPDLSEEELLNMTVGYSNSGGGSG